MIELFFDLLETQLSQKRRVLVFSQFTRMLDLIGVGLEERKIAYVELTGHPIPPTPTPAAPQPSRSLLPSR